MREAAKRAIERCLKEGILKDILSQYRTEINQLVLKLLHDNRLSDLERASSEREYQEQLLAEYGIQAEKD